MSDGRVFRASHREELRHAIERAYERRQSVQVVGGSRRGSRRAETLLRAPGGILDLWPADLVARVGAGTSVLELERALEPLGLETGLFLPLPERATLGGIFASGEASRVGGANRALRELALGAVVIDGRGRPVECGARVVKNVAGYDVLRLHHGAGGGLGILSDLILRLRARSESRAARFLTAPWHELPDLLPEWRRRAGADAEGELILDAEAARRSGLGDAAGVCFIAEGRASVLRDWQKRVGGVEVGDRLPALRDLGWSEDTRAELILRGVTRTSRLLESWLDLSAVAAKAGDRVALVHDGRTGVFQVLGFGSATGPGRELVRRVGAELGPVGVDRGRVEALRPSAHPRERWLRRLRESWDPAGILPPLRRRYEVGS